MVQMNALMVWMGIGLVGFGLGALMVALQVRPPRDDAQPGSGRNGPSQRTRESAQRREMAAH